MGGGGPAGQPTRTQAANPAGVRAGTVARTYMRTYIHLGVEEGRDRLSLFMRGRWLRGDLSYWCWRYKPRARVFEVLLLQHRQPLGLSQRRLQRLDFRHVLRCRLLEKPLRVNAKCRNAGSVPAQLWQTSGSDLADAVALAAPWES